MNGPGRRESNGGRKSRQKELPIQGASSTSPHLVDLSSFSPDAPRGPRPELDLSQKLSVWTRMFRRSRHEREHRAIVPFLPQRKAPRASIIEFLTLPFAIARLCWKRGAACLSPRGARRRPAPIPSAPPSPADEYAAPPPVTIVLSKKPEPKFSFFPDAAWKRHVLRFAVVAVLVTLPLQALLSYAGLLRRAGVIAADAREAVDGLQKAGGSAAENAAAAETAFRRSASAFASTRERVDDLTVRLAALLSGNGGKLSSGTELLRAGESLAKAGAELARGLEAMRTSQETNAVKLERMAGALAAALPHLEEGVDRLGEITPRNLPEGYRPAFAHIRADVQAAFEDIKRASASSGVLLDAIGANGKRRYLVVFQNAHELRPTGGFIGSFALMDLEDGRIERIEIPAGGSYDLRGGFNRRVAAPEPLRLVNPRWEFQDANWFADFPSSARALIWFYEKSGGPTVDGVIAVTSNLMQDLLRAIGPVEMPEYGKTVTAGNFQLETQKAVEIEYDRETNRPKQIIADMAPKVLKKLVDGGSADLPALSGALGKALASKDIQVYFRDQEAQEAAADFGWTGTLEPLARQADYLAVIDTNIAGGKTDGVIDERIRHETSFERDGSILNTVAVTRSHRGKPGELFTGTKNIDYQRFYVPLGSTLLSAEGFEVPGAGYFLPADPSLQPSTVLAAVEGPTATHAPSGTTIHEEAGLTVFGNWFQLEPGETKTATIRYRLPFRLQDLARTPATWTEKLKAAFGAYVPTADFRLVVHKQAGAANRTFESRIAAPSGWAIQSSVPESARAAPGSLEYETPLDQDLYVGMVLAHHE